MSGVSFTAEESGASRPPWWAGLLVFFAAFLLEALLVLPLFQLIVWSGAAPEQAFFDSWWQVGYKLACELGTIAIMFGALRLGRRPVRLNLSLAPVAWWAALLVVIMMLALGPWERWIGEVVDPSWSLASSRERPPLSGPVFVVLAIRVLLVPVEEELVFRGYVLSAFRRSSVVLAVLVSTPLFASIHFDGQSLRFLTHLPFGVLAALCVLRLGSIYPVILGHVAWNLLASFHASPPGWLEAGPLPLALSALVVGGGLFLLYRLPEPDREASG